MNKLYTLKTVKDGKRLQGCYYQGVSHIQSFVIHFSQNKKVDGVKTARFRNVNMAEIPTNNKDSAAKKEWERESD